MHTNISLRGIALFALVALASACSDASRSTVDPNVPPEVVAYADDWPLPGRDYLNSRATFDSSIDSTNVATLTPAWQVPLPGAGGYGNAATTPIIAGDRIYIQDLSSNVRAIDRETGALRWAREYGGFVIGPNGVAVGWGKVFAIRGTDTVVALDAATGAELWARPLKITATDGLDIQPTVYGNLVFASTVPVSLTASTPAATAARCSRSMQETGEAVWSFDTIESPDLWGNPEVNSGGGAGSRRRSTPTRGPHLLGRRQPGAVPRHAGVPERHEPPRSEPVHRVAGRARRPERRARLVPAGDPARHLRPRPGPLAAGRRRAERLDPAHRRRDGQGRQGHRPRHRHRCAAVDDAGRPPPERRARRRSTVRPSSCPARSAACSRRPRRPTASSTSRR